MAKISFATSSRGLLIVSFAVAVMSASTGDVLPASYYVALCVLWLAIVAVAIIKHGRSGLPTLFGAPLVAWPCMPRLLDWLCNHGYNACI
jgi:hypothetical protein